MMISNEDLLIYNSRGLIPGPFENNNQYQQRVCSSPSLFTFKIDRLKKFDLKPDWICVQKKNKGLFPWEGGCLFIEEGTIPKASIQLRSRLRFYSDQEILSHEMIHAARLSFDEPKFEEMLAYQTSSSFLRRFLGPIFKTSKESLLFSMSCFFVLIAQLLSIFYESERLAYYSIAALFGISTVLLFRLAKDTLIFKKCLKKLRILSEDSNKEHAIMVRLTDQEIIDFSQLTIEQIKDYVDLQRLHSLRWKILYQAYFSK